MSSPFAEQDKRIGLVLTFLRASFCSESKREEPGLTRAITPSSRQHTPRIICLTTGGRYQRNCPRASCIWRAKCWPPSLLVCAFDTRTCRSFVFPLCFLQEKLRIVSSPPFVFQCLRALVISSCKVPAKKAVTSILFVKVSSNALTRK